MPERLWLQAVGILEILGTPEEKEMKGSSSKMWKSEIRIELTGLVEVGFNRRRFRSNLLADWSKYGPAPKYS